MTKKNEPTNYTPVMQIQWSQVITSLFIGAILGGIALLRFSDSQAVIVAGHSSEISEIQQDLVPRSEFEAVILRIDQRLESNEKILERIDKKLD
jgi:hypothetical protein